MLTDDEAKSINQRVFETSQDLILVTDGYGVLLQVSPSSMAILGYAPEEMIGQSGARFMMPDDLDATRSEMRAARAGRATRHFGCRYLHKDGRVVPLMWMGVWSEPDHHHFFIGRDMTDRERTEAQLRQSQKMEAVGLLTGGIAHDFNNILMIILANVDALQEEQSLASPLRVYLDQIGGAAQRAADLTRQLLAFSRKQALRPTPTDVNELVGGTTRLLRRSLGERIEIATRLALNLWTTNVDHANLEAVLVNLSLNARDAMPDGGRLLVETANVAFDDDDLARNPEAVRGDYVMLSVSDTGSGMPPDVLEKVFEPFFTTKEVGKGSGLGLSMVYGFIKQSNGHIKISSEVGRGTAVRLYLPRWQGSEAAAATRSVPATSSGGERVLVVEDDEQVRRSVVQQLGKLGYSVSESASGADALRDFGETMRRFDVLVTDIVMPGAIDGRRLAEEARQRAPAIGIVLMSGYSEDAVFQSGKLPLEARLLTKPFRRADLAQAIREVLDGTPNP